MNRERLKRLELTLDATAKGIKTLHWNKRGDGSVLLSQDEAEGMEMLLKGVHLISRADLLKLIDEEFSNE